MNHHYRLLTDLSPRLCRIVRAAGCYRAPGVKLAGRHTLAARDRMMPRWMPPWPEGETARTWLVWLSMCLVRVQPHPCEEHRARVRAARRQRRRQLPLPPHRPLDLPQPPLPPPPPSRQHRGAEAKDAPLPTPSEDDGTR